MKNPLEMGESQPVEVMLLVTRTRQMLSISMFCTCTARKNGVRVCNLRQKYCNERQGDDKRFGKAVSS